MGCYKPHITTIAESLCPRERNGLYKPISAIQLAEGVMGIRLPRVEYTCVIL